MKKERLKKSLEPKVEKAKSRKTIYPESASFNKILTNFGAIYNKHVVKPQTSRFKNNEKYAHLNAKIDF